MIIGLCSTSTLTEDQLMQLLNDQEKMKELRQEYQSISDVEDHAHSHPLEHIDVAHDTRLRSNEGVSNIGNSVSKRPWCNGFTGCGKLHGKRSLSSSAMLEHSQPLHAQSLHASSITETKSKRPFCNGFFGCGNPGKRLVFGRLNSNKSNKATEQRFCNSFGCLKGVKRGSITDNWLDQTGTSF